MKLIRSLWLLQLCLTILLLGAASRQASADYEYWTGNSSASYNDPGNWNNHVPNSYDDAWFTAPSANMTLTYSSSYTPPRAWLFDGNAAGYTIGTPGDTNTIIINQFIGGIDLRAGLQGHGGSETFNEPISFNGGSYFGNFSPGTTTGITPNGLSATSIYGVGGYNNTLIFNNTISSSNGGNLNLVGIGNFQFNGNIDNTVTNGLNDASQGTVTFSGTNSYTGNNTVGEGNLVLDYTTNNTNKLSSGNDLTLSQGNGYGGSPFNSGGGGSLTIIGNNSAATYQAVNNLYLQNGQSAITVNGGTGQTATLSIQNINQQASGWAGLVNFNTNATGVITTTTGNAGIYDNTNGITYNGSIIGEFATFGERYWATATPTATSGVYSIGGLTTDDGDSFSSLEGNYTVDAAGQSLSGTSEAQTVRFAAASGGALDIGGGSLNLSYGGVMVTQDVTGNTSIANGNLTSYGPGMDVFNYGTGTLTIAANINQNSFAKGGAGTVVLSGNNSFHNNAIVIAQGKLVVGSSTALGTDNYVLMSGQSTLDLDGHNITVTELESNNDNLPGNQAAAAGYNSQVVNSAAGTIARLTVEGNINSGGNGFYNAASDHTWGDSNIGQYTGGMNEASGAILSLDVERGAAQYQAQFDFGTSDPWGGDVAGFNQASSSGLTGYATLFTGSVTVGNGANLALLGYSNVQTMGATVLNGSMGWKTDQGSSYGTTYLTGTGNVTGNQGANFWLNVSGSTTDTFNGYFGSGENLAGTGLDGTGFSLDLAGTGSATFTNAVNANGVNTFGTTHLTMPGLINGSWLTANGQSSITITGTSGNVVGGNVQLIDGTLILAPSGSGANVAINSSGNSLNGNGTSMLVLDRGQNNSLTYTIGSGGNAYLNPGFDGTFLLGSAQGVSALGVTDKLVFLSPNGFNFDQNEGVVGQYNQSSFGVDMTPGGTQAATFLTYSGTGASTDAGFMAYQFTGANTNAITGGQVVLINANQSLAQSAGFNYLEIDGAHITSNGFNLDVSEYGNWDGGLILNGGASISGSVTMGSGGHIYVDLANASIGNLSIGGGQQFAKDGAGTLTLGGFNSGGNVRINDGALDVGDVGSVESSALALYGGVLQGNGHYSAVLGGGGGNVSLSNGNTLSGGFSARGGALIVDLSGSTGENLVWGSTSNFLASGGVLLLNSTTANSVVEIMDNIDLGAPGNGSSLYGRVVKVTANSSDAGVDPLAVSDVAILAGVISSNTDAYQGLEKDGTGVLYLANANTYTGATVIAQGTVAIYADNNLGTAASAAYALNTATGGLNGGALTPGAVQINSGATLAFSNLADSSDTPTTNITLSSNRQILLASGNGSVASNVDVQTGITANFGGLIGDYVGEVGSLNKEGAGTFNYSGVSANTGFDSVSGGKFAVTGAGSVNSVSGIVLNNATSTSAAEFNYSSSTALTRGVTFAAAANGHYGGGTFSYNSSAAYTGGALNVINHGVLSGSGNLGTTVVTIGATGTITPGQIDPTPGTLTQGATTFLTGGNYNFLVADATGAAGTGYSTVNATSLDISALGTFTINLESLNGAAPGNAANFDPTQSYSFVLVDAAGGISGAFSPSQFIVMTAPNNGATGFSNAFTGAWSVSESGNDLLLDYTAAAVPEPSTYALLGLGLAGLVGFNRWRKRNA